MKRRFALMAPLLLGACSILPDRPYQEKRAWPLIVDQPNVRRPRTRGKVLLVRTVTAAPGLQDRGLLTLQADGSMRTSLYEEWIAPPAAAVEESLRRWLAGSGLFAAVVSPGSRGTPDLVLECELTALWADPAAHRTVAGIAFALFDERNRAQAVLAQHAVTGTAPLAALEPQASVDAQKQALADAFGQIEKDLAKFA
jgi:cholesterol transport system auxiliary component